MPYNPFDKPLGTLTPDDLQLLVERQVAEGYFVEYKSQFPSNQKVARSVASFANAYGGWYIIGVKANTQNQAQEICGFDLKITPDPISKVRDIVKSHTSPIPLFHQQMVTLPDERVVLLVYVPGDQDTPFITNDGRIYRRNNDSSDPVPENDRHTIDKLVEAGRRSDDEFAAFCQDDRTFSNSEDGMAWLRIFLSHPRGVIAKTDIILNADLQARLERTKFPVDIVGRETTWFSSTIPFNVAQPRFRSVVLRHVETHRLAFNSFEMELFVDGRAKFFIPLSYFGGLGLHTPTGICSERVQAVFQMMAGDDPQKKTAHLHFLDVARMWLVVAWCLGYYYDWIGTNNRLFETRIAASLDGVWRSVPFFDSDEWAAQVEKSGLPVMGRDAVSIPDPPGGTVWLGETFNLRWLIFCHMIGFALGLPYEISEDIIFQVVRRAADEQKLQ